ncbi:BsuPI-related putative proteinase inhibitor [Bacillus pinisoli]|uniref:BsuPI-related putative proteinase inhibitor n=1 Tax=Bacillus pinisoli TaxID=2901866 RepID=UPI001FF2C6E5|nr:BsuPI-related putative proteinase inhibitor [Bacillus pinisoli]
MKYFMFFISFLFIFTGCGADRQETNGGSADEESKETTSPSIDLADIDLGLDIKPTKENVGFTMNFKNNADEPVEFTFSSGQKFEVVVKDQSGQEVYRFSKGKMFTMALEMLKLKAGESVTYKDVWEYKKEGVTLEPGEYQVVASVIPIEMNGEKLGKDPFTAEGSFTIETSAEAQATEKSESEGSQDEQKQNPAFRNIKAAGSNGEYVITGEARVFEAVFMYAVEDGHHQLVKETPFFANEGAPSWSSFELKISIPKDQLPTEGTVTAHIYERSAKDGSIVNSYFVTLEQF